MTKIKRFSKKNRNFANALSRERTILTHHTIHTLSLKLAKNTANVSGG
jgi:hypothetical protein